MSEPGSPTQSVLAPRPSDTKITLQVGDSLFVTTRKTLTNESGFFSSLLSGRWDSDVQPDGSYFIDADACLFEHILRYLRRGVLPIFYNASKGHDHALYLALAEEAKYFQIPRLAAWIQEKKYLQAVKVRISASEFQGADDTSEIMEAGVEVEYHPAWKTEKVYVCPRGIRGHRGRPSACGKQCRNVQGDDEVEYEDEEVLKVLVIRKHITFNQEICVEGR